MKINIVLLSGICIRNFLHTRVLEELAADPSVTIQVITSDKYASLFRDKNVKVSVVNAEIGLIAKVLHAYNRQLHYLLVKTHSMNELRKSPLYPTVRGKVLSHLASMTPFKGLVTRLLRVALSCDFKFRRTIFPRDLLDEDDLLVLTNPVTTLEAHIALNTRARIVFNIKSFDNVTTKGYFPRMPELFQVWDDLMYRHLTEIFNVASRRISKIGAPHLSYNFVYEKYRGRSTRSIKTRVLYASVASEINPYDEETVKWLLENLDSKHYDLKVRMHHLDRVQKWKDLNLLNKISNYSDQISGDLRVASLNSLESLYEDLSDTDIVVHTASTIFFEAALFNIPTIGIAFDCTDVSLSRYYNFEHYAPYVKHGCLALADTKQSLLNLICDTESLRREIIPNINVLQLHNKYGKRYSELFLESLRG